VSQAGTVAWLALRELWMSFRLLMVLVVNVGAGALVGLLPAAPATTLARLAIGLGLATAVTSAVAAWSLADERLAGRAGWLVTRSVPRGTYLAGWFAALALVAAVGVAAAGILGWLAIGGATLDGDAAGFAATVAAVAATTAAAVSLGLLSGSLLRAPGAILAAVVACAVLAAVAWLASSPAPWLPGGAHLMLARLAGPEAVLPDALRAAGIGLALTSALLVAARAALERADL
jgi:hypothetical protein